MNGMLTNGSFAVMRAPVAILLVALVALAPLGCAHRRPEPVSVTPDKPATGTVALAVSPTVPDGLFQRPGAVGAGQGAKEGAVVGAVVTLVPGLVVTKVTAEAGSAQGLVVGLMMLGAGLVLAPVGAGVGAALGAIVAPSRDEVERTALTLEQALADTNFHEALTAWILKAAGERPVVAGTAPESVVADTVLEVNSVDVALVSRTRRTGGPPSGCAWQSAEGWFERRMVRRFGAGGGSTREPRHASSNGAGTMRGSFARSWNARAGPSPRR